MGQEHVHYASNIVSNSRRFHSKSIDIPTHKIWLLKFDPENPRSRSWVRSKFKVITWVQHLIDSHPSGSISIHPLIPMIELFQNVTFKIQGRSQSSMSHIMYNNLSTHIPVIPPADRSPFLRCNCLKKWPWKFKVKVMGEVKSLTQYWLTSLWFHVPFLSYSIFQIWPRKYKVKAIAQGHKVDITPYLTLPFLGYIYFKIWRRKFKVKVMGEVRVESQKMDPINIRSTHILSVPCQSGIPFLSFDFFKIWPWKSRVKGMGEATVQSNNNNNNNNDNNNLYWHKYRSSTSWLNSILQCTASLGLSQLWLYALYSTHYKCMGVKQSHNVGLTSYRLASLSFHVNRPSHS